MKTLPDCPSLELKLATINIVSHRLRFLLRNSSFHVHFRASPRTVFNDLAGAVTGTMATTDSSSAL